MSGNAGGFGAMRRFNRWVQVDVTKGMSDS
jgi:hypothetical protein